MNGGTALTDNVQYWAKTKSLMITSMVIWAIFGFAIHAFAPVLNEIVILGFPLGFYMAAQGSLIVFVVLIFWFARRQDAIDRESGVAEAD
jgi:putative solute:sodium symporter small subunit